MASTPTAPQERDLVFCHECEDEWYRDEHGLVPCPSCQSEFTEIIEHDHDPRYEEEHEHEHEHVHEHGLGDSFADDPEEEDITHLPGIQWQQVGPGEPARGHISMNRTINLGPGQQVGGGGIMGLVGSLLQSAMGVTTAQQPQGQQEPASGSDSSNQGPNTQSDNGNAPGGFRYNVQRSNTVAVHISRTADGRTIFSTATDSSPMQPRNHTGSHPGQNPPDHINQMLEQMIGNIGVMPGFPPGRQGPGFGARETMGEGAGAGRPANILDQIISVLGAARGGVMGDAVFSDEALDRVMTQLMEQHTSGNAPGPATEEAIRALPTKQISEKDVGDNGTADCSICMDSVEIGGTVTVLPCTHWFHFDCIQAWLHEHDTCPHCRKGIMSKEGEGSTDRPRDPSQTSQNHSNASTSAQSMPGTFPQQNRSSRGSDASANLFARMRDTFSGDGNGNGNGGNSSAHNGRYQGGSGYS